MPQQDNHFIQSFMDQSWYHPLHFFIMNKNGNSMMKPFCSQYFGSQSDSHIILIQLGMLRRQKSLSRILIFGLEIQEGLQGLKTGFLESFGLETFMSKLTNSRYYIFMPEGDYKFNKEYTAEECEMDDDNGILETETRVLTFTAPNHFKYTYHYFYQYENSYYVMVDDVRNDTVVSGTFVADGNKIVATIVSGEQVARDHAKELDLGSKENITGTITFEETEDKLKILSFELNPKDLHRIESMIFEEASFKKCQ